MMYIGSKLISPTFGSVKAIEQLSSLSLDLDEINGEVVTQDTIGRGDDDLINNNPSDNENK